MFTPLGVHSPEFGSRRLSTSNSTSTYTVFDFNGGRPLVMDRIEPFFEKMSPIILPAGGLNISVADFAVWFSALLDERIISMASLNEIWIPTKLNDGTIFKLQRPSGSPQWSAYGLGWVLRPEASPPWVGCAGGLRAAFLIYPDNDLAVIAFTNLQGAGPEALVDGIARHYLEN